MNVTLSFLSKAQIKQMISYIQGQISLEMAEAEISTIKPYLSEINKRKFF